MFWTFGDDQKREISGRRKKFKLEDIIYIVVNTTKIKKNEGKYQVEKMSD